MPDVRIYQPRKTAMQSGRARTRYWLVEYEPAAKVKNDPLMGWVGHGDTRNQLRMRFDTREEAVAFCQKHELSYQLIDPKPRKLQHKSYADNFRFDRDKNWTH